ncbi:hypothetical protein FWH13_01405 [Candidatus Saccharibacteria bacterium]|nr:hypothetical protein [Candidatus Saccharibacteria bacterium]
MNLSDKSNGLLIHDFGSRFPNLTPDFDYIPFLDDLLKLTKSVRETFQNRWGTAVDTSDEDQFFATYFTANVHLSLRITIDNGYGKPSIVRLGTREIEELEQGDQTEIIMAFVGDNESGVIKAEIVVQIPNGSDDDYHTAIGEIEKVYPSRIQSFFSERFPHVGNCEFCDK